MSDWDVPYLNYGSGYIILCICQTHRLKFIVCKLYSIDKTQLTTSNVGDIELLCIAVRNVKCYNLLKTSFDSLSSSWTYIYPLTNHLYSWLYIQGKCQEYKNSNIHNRKMWWIITVDYSSAINTMNYWCTQHGWISQTWWVKEAWYNRVHIL